MSAQDNIQNKIQELQQQYYSKNSKNYFLKNAQKQDCAAHITRHIDITLLLEKTFSIDEKGIHLDYQTLKTYATPSNYEQIVSHMIALAQTYIQTYGKYDLHVNLKSFTITAAQRNKEVIRVFCDKCMRTDTLFYNHLNTIYLYECPSLIQTLHKLFGGFVDRDAKNKIVIIK